MAKDDFDKLEKRVSDIEKTLSKKQRKKQLAKKAEGVRKSISGILHNISNHAANLKGSSHDYLASLNSKVSASIPRIKITRKGVLYSALASTLLFANVLLYNNSDDIRSGYRVIGSEIGNSVVSLQKRFGIADYVQKTSEEHPRTQISLGKAHESTGLPALEDNLANVTPSSLEEKAKDVEQQIYAAKKGDSLWKIASRYTSDVGSAINAFCEKNGKDPLFPSYVNPDGSPKWGNMEKNPNYLEVGQKVDVSMFFQESKKDDEKKPSSEVSLKKTEKQGIIEILPKNNDSISLSDYSLAQNSLSDEVFAANFFSHEPKPVFSQHESFGGYSYSYFPKERFYTYSPGSFRFQPEDSFSKPKVVALEGFSHPVWIYSYC